MSRLSATSADALRPQRTSNAPGIQPGQGTSTAPASAPKSAPPTSAVTAPKEQYQPAPGESEPRNQHSPVPKILQSLGVNGSQPQTPHQNVVQPPPGLTAANAAPAKSPPPVPPLSPSHSSSQGSGASSNGGGGGQGGQGNGSFLQFSGGMTFSGSLGGNRYQAYRTT